MKHYIALLTAALLLTGLLTACGDDKGDGGATLPKKDTLALSTYQITMANEDADQDKVHEVKVYTSAEKFNVNGSAEWLGYEESERGLKVWLKEKNDGKDTVSVTLTVTAGTADARQLVIKSAPDQEDPPAAYTFGVTGKRHYDFTYHGSVEGIEYETDIPSDNIPEYIVIEGGGEGFSLKFTPYENTYLLGIQADPYKNTQEDREATFTMRPADGIADLDFEPITITAKQTRRPETAKFEGFYKLSFEEVFTRTVTPGLWNSVDQITVPWYPSSSYIEIISDPDEKKFTLTAPLWAGSLDFINDQEVAKLGLTEREFVITQEDDMSLTFRNVRDLGNIFSFRPDGSVDFFGPALHQRVILVDAAGDPVATPEGFYAEIIQSNIDQTGEKPIYELTVPEEFSGTAAPGRIAVEFYTDEDWLPLCGRFADFKILIRERADHPNPEY